VHSSTGIPSFSCMPDSRLGKYLIFTVRFPEYTRLFLLCSHSNSFWDTKKEATKLRNGNKFCTLRKLLKKQRRLR
jgi:hypothetical protein